MTISTSPNFASIIGPRCLLTTYLEWTWVGDGPPPAALKDSPAPTYGSFRLIRGFSFRPSIPLPPDMSWKLPPSPVHGRRYVDRARSTSVGLTWTSVQVSWQPFIHTVPAETLAEIFLLVRDSLTVSSISATRDHGQVHAGDFALLRMTAVCPRWRLVAINSSVLWNNIVFSTLGISSIRCAELFLGRTKNCALYIYISAPALPVTPSTSASMHNLFVGISSESHRIRAFDFFATPKTNILYT